MGMAAETAWHRGAQQALQPPSNKLKLILMGLLLSVVVLLGHFQASDSRCVRLGVQQMRCTAEDPTAARGSLCRSPDKAGSANYLILTDVRSPACNVSTQYLPSGLEQLWMTNAVAWGVDFCSHMSEVENSTRMWLDTLTQHTQLQENCSVGQSPAEVRENTGQQCKKHTLPRPLCLWLLPR